MWDHPYPHTRSGSAFPGSRAPVSAPSQQSPGTGTSPFVPLMSLKYLAWDPASLLLWGQEGGREQDKTHASWALLVPGRLAWGLPGTDLARAQPGTPLRPPAFLSPPLQGIPKIEIARHTYEMETWGWAQESGMCILRSTAGDSVIQ